MNPLIFILFVPFVFLTMTHNCTKETLKEYTIVEERKRKAGLFETRLLKNTAVTFSTIIHYKIYRVWSVNDEAARDVMVLHQFFQKKDTASAVVFQALN